MFIFNTFTQHTRAGTFKFQDQQCLFPNQFKSKNLITVENVTLIHPYKHSSENNPQRSRHKTEQADKNNFEEGHDYVSQKALEKQSQQHYSCAVSSLQQKQAWKDDTMFFNKKKTSQTGILTS